MVDIICDEQNPFHIHAHKIATYLWNKIPGINAILTIEKDGRPIESRISVEFEQEYETNWLKSLATLVSIRYPIADFHKQLSGLEMTVNIFKEKIVIVRQLDISILLIGIISKQTDLNMVIDCFSLEKNWNHS